MMHGFRISVRKTALLKNGVFVLLVVYLFMVRFSGLAESAMLDELRSKGISAGGLNIFPNLKLGYYTDSNIYSEEKVPTSDSVTQIEPSLLIQTNWSRHRFYIQGGGELYSYQDHSNENHTDIKMMAGGKLDITKKTSLQINRGMNVLFEDRGSPDDAKGISPTRYNLNTVNLLLDRKGGVLFIVIDGGIKTFLYDDTTTSTGVINNDDRDRTENNVSLKLGFQFHPGFQLVVKGGFNQRLYATLVDDNGFNRHSTGNDISTGLKFDFGGPLVAELLLGQWSQIYDDVKFGQTNGFSYSGVLSWSPTRLTSINSILKRTVEETTLNGSSGVFSSNFNFEIQHALLRSVVINLGFAGGVMEFQKTGRVDNITSPEIGIRYLANRYLHIKLGYSQKKKVSTDTGSGFDRSETKFAVVGRI